MSLCSIQPNCSERCWASVGSRWTCISLYMLSVFFHLLNAADLGRGMIECWQKTGFYTVSSQTNITSRFLTSIYFGRKLQINADYDLLHRVTEHDTLTIQIWCPLLNAYCLFSSSWQELWCISSVKYIKYSLRFCWTTASCSRNLILLVPRIVVIPVVFVVVTVCLRISSCSSFSFVYLLHIQHSRPSNLPPLPSSAQNLSSSPPYPPLLIYLHVHMMFTPPYFFSFLFPMFCFAQSLLLLQLTAAKLAAVQSLFTIFSRSLLFGPLNGQAGELPAHSLQ